MALISIRKALIVDEDADVDDQLSRILHRIGALEIIKLNDFNKTMQYINTDDQIDFVVLDLNFEDVYHLNPMNTFSARGNRIKRNIPYLLICNVTNRLDLIRLSKSGYLDVSLKPLNDNILEKKIKQKIVNDLLPEQEAEAIRKFNNLLEQKKFNEAKETILPILKRHQTSPKYLTYYADLLFQTDEINSAKNIIKNALKIDPEFMPAMNLMEKINELDASIMAENERIRQIELEKQQQEREERAKLKADIMRTLRMKTEEYLMDDKLDDAILIMDKALENPKYAKYKHEIIYEMALANNKFAKYERTLELCIKCMQAAPKEYDLPVKLLGEVKTHLNMQGSIMDQLDAIAAGAFAEGGNLDSLLDQINNKTDEQHTQSDDKMPTLDDEFIKFIMFEA